LPSFSVSDAGIFFKQTGHNDSVIFICVIYFLKVNIQ